MTTVSIRSVIQLKQLCERITKGSTPTSYGFSYQSQGIRFVKAENIDEKGVVFSTTDYIDEKTNDFLKRSILKEDDLLFSIAGTIGRVGLIGKRDLPANINQALAIIRLLPGGINPRYLFYYLKSDVVQRRVQKQTVGVGRANVSLGNLGEVEVPVVGLDVQQHIVAEIEKQFSRLDEAVVSLKRIKANLKRYKAAALKAAIEGKLTEDWRKQHPDVEPASKLLERIIETGAKDSLKDYEPLDVSRLEQLPNGWRWVRVEDLGYVQLGRQRAPKYHSGKHMRPYLRVQNVFEDRIDLNDVMEMDFPHDDYKKFKLESGDILLNEGQSPELLGRPAIYRGELPDACFTNTLIRFRAHAALTPKFPLIVFRAYMRTGRFTREGTITTNIAHLSAGRFAKIEFPLPPLKEQQEIVAEVERRLSVIDELESTVQANLTRADRLRQAILNRAFTGKLSHCGLS